MREALSDVRVVDLTRALAGPFATMILGDMGAEVIKVEHPDGGDNTRQTPNTFHPDDEIGLFGGYFNSVNRNKKSVTIDLKTDQGKEVFYELVGTADVVIENFRRGVPERLGVDYETLADVNPGVVYCSISGYGDPSMGESPYARKPAFDVIAQAVGGAMYITSPEAGGGPTKIGPGIGDIVPALFAANGILTALHHRTRTGAGQRVDVALYDAVVALCERSIYTHSYRGVVEEAAGNAHPMFAPFGVFETADGHVAIAAPRDALWARLCAHMDRPDLVDDPRFATARDRAQNYPALKAIMEEWLSAYTKREVFKMISDDVPCGPVNNAADIVRDPHIRARDMLAMVEQPLGNDESATVQIANTPIKLSHTPGGVERRGPTLGEQNDEILTELGYTDEEIQALYNEDVITPHPITGGGNF